MTHLLLYHMKINTKDKLSVELSHILVLPNSFHSKEGDRQSLKVKIRINCQAV